MKKLKLVMIITLCFSITSCSSYSDKVEPKPFSSQKSKALNIASQTDLVNSTNLRDFTLKEAQMDEPNETIGKAENAGLTFTTLLGIASLNPMGILTVQAGGALNRMKTLGLANQPRLIIADPDTSLTPEQVKEKNIKLYLKGIQELLPKGLNLVEGSYMHGTQYYGVNINGKFYDLTFVSSEKPILDQTLLYNQNYKNAYLMGTKKFKNGAIGPLFPTIFIKNLVPEYLGAKGYVQFIENVSKKLPQGYYFYIPSYYELNDRSTNKYYTFTTKVPSVITGGKEYPFIKPNQTTLASN